MSSLGFDLGIWVLLALGVGFGLIGLIGLFLFPDTRSRMYTAVRATMISQVFDGLAVLIYGIYALQTSGGVLYQTLILHTVVLVVIVGLGNYGISRKILEKTRYSKGNLLSPEKKG